MKQWFYTIHGWLGLNFGLMLFIVCLSGTIAVVSHEIDWLCTPSLRVTPTETRASWGTMTNAVRAAYPDSELQYVNAPLGAWFACEFILKSPARVSKRVYVDPYTGSVKGHAPWFNAQRFFRDFHRRFFWYSWLGIWVVAAFGFVLLGAVASGLAFYKRWWSKLFVLRRRKGGRIFFSDFHRLVGVWTFLFALLISVTGIWYLVEIPIGWANLYERPSLPKVPRTTLDSLQPNSSRLSPDAWVDAANEAMPDLQIRSISFPDSFSRPAGIDGQASAWLVRNRANRVLIDPYTGELLFKQRAENLPLLARWVDTADELHFGTFGGLPTKLIWFVFGIALSALMPTGAYLWVRRRTQMADGIRKRLKADHNQPFAAELVVQWQTRRNVAIGVLSTAGIWLLAIGAIWSALARQLNEAGPEYGWQSLGSPGAIVVYGSFLLLILAATIVWYRVVWFPRLATVSPLESDSGKSSEALSAEGPDDRQIGLS